MNQKIPVPVTFNPYKHHFGFLLEQTEQWKNQDWDVVSEALRSIGQNLIDLYLGHLQVEAVCNECIDFFQKAGISRPGLLKKWLHPREYRKIELSDKSMWVIKEGIDNERFIHIHPAKNSPFSVRVRATTLKTVIALMVHNQLPEKEHHLNLQAVNRIRTECLGLSPVKSLTHGKGIARLWEIFHNH